MAGPRTVLEVVVGVWCVRVPFVGMLWTPAPATASESAPVAASRQVETMIVVELFMV
jgi:hypothetical protein